MKLTKCIPLLALFLCACNVGNSKGIIDYNPNKSETNDQFNFEGNYTPPELTIDGLKNDEQWTSCSEELKFGAQNQCSMVLYRGERALFCYFEVSDKDIQTVGNNNGDDVTEGDSVEVYFDFKNDAASKPQNDDIQINIGAHGKTRIFVGSNGQWGSWNGLLDYEIVLNGTLNDDTDVDEGYTVELMVPYAQVGIDKNSTFGVAVGHVARGLDSTHDTLQYTWGGLTYEGSFIDPQVPNAYIVYQSNYFYARNNLPVGNITLEGTIVDENNSPLKNVDVKLDDQVVKTNSQGKYVFNNILADENHVIEISKDGYKTYSKNINPSELKTLTGSVSIILCLISNNVTKNITISGIVKNPTEGLIKNALIKLGDNQTESDDNGEFTISTIIDYDLNIILDKEGYKESITRLNTLDLAREPIFDIGTLNLYSPSSTTSFGGARGITKVDVEIYRGFEGINFLFKTENSVSNGDHIELFIDSGKSFNGRDSSDYRIDFKGDGGISIVNFGDGQNTIVSSSGITNYSYLQGVHYYIEAMIPYSFLGVTEKDIIGVSFGMWSEKLKDWDGWDFDGYVAPEYTDQYCRIGLDNGLYRASSNSVETTRVYGYVKNKNGQIIYSAQVNGKQVNEEGYYSIYVIGNDDFDIQLSAVGYTTKTITILGEELNGEDIRMDVELVELSKVTITGTCNVDGAKVYLEADPNVYTFVENGTYTIQVSSGKNAYLIFEKEGYQQLRKGFGQASLDQAVIQNVVITYNAEMKAI